MFQRVFPLYEKLTAKRVLGFLIKHDILAPQLHAFRPRKFRTPAVTTITFIINNTLNDVKHVLGIFLDEKAPSIRFTMVYLFKS